LPTYPDAFNKGFNTLKQESVHINAIKLSGDMDNNKMERFDGEVRDREKVVRGSNVNDTHVLSGYRMYHNFIRPPEALKGKLPTEACGIEVKCENKWKTLIQNASHL
jgi:hypothetical protein